VLLGVGALGAGYIYLNRVDLGLSRLSVPGETSRGAFSDASGGLAAPAAHPAHISWEKVDRSPDGFKVEMPADIKDLQIPAYNEVGGSDQVSMIFANPDAETTFAVAWADDPPVARTNGDDPEKILDMARDDAMARTQTSLTGETQTTVAGYPARDFSARNWSGGVMNSRMIYIKPRLYMLVASFPSARARREEDVLRFFNSFAIVSSAKNPERPPLAPAQR
jgi:hypothetical protein